MGEGARLGVECVSSMHQLAFRKVDQIIHKWIHTDKHTMSHTHKDDPRWVAGHSAGHGLEHHLLEAFLHDPFRSSFAQQVSDNVTNRALTARACTEKLQNGMRFSRILICDFAFSTNVVINIYIKVIFVVF